MNKKPVWKVQHEYHSDLKKALWLNNRRCCYCGCVTRYSRVINGILPDDYPTVEHIYPMTDIRRLCKDGGKKRTIACNKCNVEKSKEGTRFKNTPKNVEGLLIDIYNGVYSNALII